jgi:hypothetical protein
MKNFVWAISGRREEEGYGRQAISDCWDLHINTKGEGTIVKTTNMTKANNPAGDTTVEFRLFAGDADYLVHALDFSHSVVKFLLLNGAWMKTRFKQTDSWGPPRFYIKDIPTAEQYFTWLKKQKGYKALKDFCKTNNISY